MTWQTEKLAKRIRATLRARFPRCFCAHGKAKYPLKLDTHYDAIAACPDLNAEHIMLAIDDYTRGQRYLEACIFGAIRRDLNGNEAGTVTRREAWQAARKLERLKANNARQEGRSAPAAVATAAGVAGAPQVGS